MRPEGFSLHPFLISFLPFPVWEESICIGAQFAYRCTQGFKELGVNYYLVEARSPASLHQNPCLMSAMERIINNVFSPVQ